jgi:hypothetical protein
MRIRNISLCWILFVLLLNGFAQSTDDLRNVIGFACGYSGRSTTSVRHVEAFIKQKNFDSIKILMHSPIPAIKYLSVKTSEILERKGMIQFSVAEKEVVNEIKKSKEALYACSGCTEIESYTLVELFADDSISLNKGVVNWIENCLKNTSTH